MAAGKQDIRRKTNRLKLPAQRNPFWAEIAVGLHLGYRRLEGKAGRWIARERLPNGRYQETAIGTADDLQSADGDLVLDFDQAAAKARPSLQSKGADVTTLHAAIDDWLEHKMATSRAAGHAHLRWSANQLKADFKDTDLTKMTRRKIEAWHTSQVQPGEKERSSRASADRRLTTLLAVLNRAAKANQAAMPTRPWAGVTKFGKKRAGEARTVRLDADDISSLLAALDGIGNAHFKRFVILALETGCRPSELYTARMRDWVPPVLSVDGKTGGRSFRVSPQAAAVLDECVAGRSDPAAPLILRHDGKAWDGLSGDLRKLWTRAALKAGLPPGSSLYACRHTFISAALERGANPAMLAQYCGTSVAIIQATYARFLPNYVDGLIGGLT